jgi:SAM-dependent methyltransferase
MKESEFDRFADEYHSLHAQNIRLSGEDPIYFAQYKARDAARITQATLPVPAILDFGTGVGNSLPHLREHFREPRLVGLDVSRRSLQVSQARFGDLAEFRHFDGGTIPAEDGEFGMAFAACVFHHIDHAEHDAKLRELHRILAPGGWLILYEHNPWNPLTRRAVRDCPFDENAHLIAAPVLKRRALAAGFAAGSIRYRVFFPALLSALRFLEPAMGWLPLGAQYVVACRKA